MESKLLNKNNISREINLDEILTSPNKFYTNIIYDYKVGDLVYYKFKNKQKLAKILYIYQAVSSEQPGMADIEILNDNQTITVHMCDIFPYQELKDFVVLPDKSEENTTKKYILTYNLLYILNGHEELYSTVLGPCTIKEINHNNNTITFVSDYDDRNTITTIADGTMFPGGECVIFPSKTCRDWEVFVKQLKYTRLPKGWTYFSIGKLSEPICKNIETYSDADNENYTTGNYFRDLKEAEFYKLKCIELIKSRQN